MEKIGLTMLKYINAHGRLSELASAVTVAFVVLALGCVLVSCDESKDEETKNPAHENIKERMILDEWQVTLAGQRFGNLIVDMKESDLFCTFTTDSVHFYEGKMVSYFDSSGKITESKYEKELVESYKCLFYSGGSDDSKYKDYIRITNQSFGLTLEHDTLTMQNDAWMFTLVPR